MFSTSMLAKGNKHFVSVILCIHCHLSGYMLLVSFSTVRLYAQMVFLTV